MARNGEFERNSFPSNFDLHQKNYTTKSGGHQQLETVNYEQN